jgi:Queuosine salvage protein
VLSPTETLLALPEDDTLGVLTGTAPVVREGTLVTLDAEAAERLADRWAAQPWPAITADFAAMHFNDGTERTANWMLLVDALNFCFWGEPDEPRWSVEWRGQTWDGYYALAAACTRHG